MIKRSAQEEDIMCVSIYAPNIGRSTQRHRTDANRREGRN